MKSFSPGNKPVAANRDITRVIKESAKALALKFLAEFETFDYVVAPSGSCTGMVKVHYPELFHDDPTQLARFTALSQRTYHDSCSGLRELDVYKQPRQLLATMPDISVNEMIESTTCCGFGGTFSVKYGELSTRMADNKCQHITDTHADAIVGGDLGCLLNIEGRLRRTGDLKTRVLHVAEVLSGLDKEA